MQVPVHPLRTQFIVAHRDFNHRVDVSLPSEFAECPEKKNEKKKFFI